MNWNLIKEKIVIRPIMWPFLVGMLFSIIGASANISMMAAIGGFIVFVYLLAFLVWIISEYPK